MATGNGSIARTPMESALLCNDLSKLSDAQRAEYYVARCEAAGLNPHTAPFQYLTLQGRMTLYAGREAADQLRARHGVRLEIIEEREHRDCLVVRVRATDRSGRCVDDYGAVPIAPATKGAAYADALKKALTQANRRATLALCGLGDTSEPLPPELPAAGELTAPKVPLLEDLEPHTWEDTGEDWSNDRFEETATIAGVEIPKKGDYLRIAIGDGSQPVSYVFCRDMAARGLFERLARENRPCRLTMHLTAKGTYRLLRCAPAEGGGA